MPASETSTSAEPLIKALERSVLPWAEKDGMSRALVAPPTLRELELQSKTTPLPEGMRITGRSHVGRRVPTKGVRAHDNGSILAATWPDDKQVELRAPALLCILSGESDLRLGDYIVHCKAGHFIFMPVGIPRPDGQEPHFETPVTETRYSDIFWMSPWLGQGGMECWICHSHGERHWNDAGDGVFLFNQSIFHVFESLFDEATGRGTGHEKICFHLLVSLLNLLKRELRECDLFQPGRQSIDTPVVKRPDDPRQDFRDPILRAQEYVRSHLNKPLSIEIVAQHVFLSRSQFTRRFRQVTGESFNTFITNVRVQEARFLLRDSEWSISMIANFVGLHPTQFRSVFQQHTGLSPMAFRREARGGADSGVADNDAGSGAE